MKTPLLLSLIALATTGCINTGKNMHTERAIQECRNDIGTDRRACEQSVKEERYQRDLQERIEKEE